MLLRCSAAAALLLLLHCNGAALVLLLLLQRCCYNAAAAMLLRCPRPTVKEERVAEYAMLRARARVLLPWCALACVHVSDGAISVVALWGSSVTCGLFACRCARARAIGTVHAVSAAAAVHAVCVGRRVHVCSGAFVAACL